MIDSNIHFKNITPDDLLKFGAKHLAYIKPVNIDGMDGYSVYRADGTFLSSYDTNAEAAAGAMRQELLPVIVH